MQTDVGSTHTLSAGQQSSQAKHLSVRVMEGRWCGRLAEILSESTEDERNSENETKRESISHCETPKRSVAFFETLHGTC